MRKDLTDKIIQFREERDWKQFHTIKDLCLGLGIEVAELQELFLWKTEKDVNEIIEVRKEEIEHEIADIYIFLCYLCYDLDIDMGKVVEAKIKLNKEKYPIDKFKGSNKKYNSK